MSKLVVISIDGLETQDLPFLKTLPHFGAILKNAAVVQNVKEVYPTLTYTIHTSIITGVTPDQHGIYHNTTPFLPNAHTNWNVVGYNWKMFSNEIKARTLVDAANEKGLVTAAVMWPVLGGQTPTHNLAEIWPNLKGTLRETYESSCTKSVMELYYERYIASFDWAHSIDTDSYSVEIAADMLKRFQPDLLLEHMISLDYKRHYTGNQNEQVTQALCRIDGFVGNLLQAAKDAGTYDSTNFVLLGDHGQMDVQELLRLNVLLVREGLITLDEKNLAADFTAYSFSNGYSALIVLRDPTDEAAKSNVFAVLKRLQGEYPQYIQRIYTRQEALDEEHLTGDFEFVVETTTGCVIDNHLTGEIVAQVGAPGVKAYRSNHGYHPSKGPKPPFIAFGPDIREGVQIDGADLLDECPTLAALLGVDMPQMMGKPLPILK